MKKILIGLALVLGLFVITHRRPHEERRHEEGWQWDAW